jgi:septal ring factor EnvC (AmiA/AmiB activator)
MDFNQILQIKKYITSIQEKTRNDLINYETTRTNLDTQKNEKIAKQEQLTNLQKDLKEQSQTLTVLKANKDVLLKSTMNDETKYQKLLQQAQSELESINAILSGKGSELKIKDVSKNEKIGTIIQGASCNSSGTHLHFIVKKGGATQNPLSFLKSNTDITNYSGDSSQASGDWSWPLSAPIKFNQGYGVTSSIKNSWVGKIYNFHNGIDISSSNTDVLSTTDGELYKGSYKGSGGCALKYTKVVDKTNNVETLYFHTN